MMSVPSERPPGEPPREPKIGGARSGMSKREFVQRYVLASRYSGEPSHGPEWVVGKALLAYEAIEERLR